MTPIRVPHPFRTWSLIGLLLLAGAASGCMKSAPAQAPASPVAGPCEGYSELQDQHRAVQKTLARQRLKLRAMEAEFNRTQLKLLEESAGKVALQKRLAAQDKMLDEAVQEVVRAKAKLRTIESRAEAASTMAEAEIALKATKEGLAAGSDGQGENLTRAEELLKMSTREFKNENYGGALYLAGQARGQINVVQLHRFQGEGGMSQPGETRFSQPLPLKTLKRCNFRQLPDLKGTVIEILDQGTLIVAFAHMDNWLRVHIEDGRAGWVHQSLAGVR